MRPASVELFLPRFKIAWGTKSLAPMLKNRGIRHAFAAGKADFSGISRDRGFFISDVLQKAFVAVDEEGTEAAAATAAVAVTRGSPGAPPAVLFRADHPFLFFIADNDTGSILFMGRPVAPP